MSKAQSETCPNCGSYGGPCEHYGIEVERACLRRQLAQADERNADLARQLMEAAEERAKTLAYDDRIEAANRRLADANEELTRRYFEMRRVLESLEWYDEGTEPSGRGYRHFRVCPICHGRQTDGHAPDCTLAAALSSAPANPQYVRHYKGGVYRVIGEATHTETGDLLTIYQSREGYVYARPTAMFEEQVEVDGESVPRFAPANPYAAVVEAAVGLLDTWDQHLEENRGNRDDGCFCSDICCEVGALRDELRDALAQLPGGDTNERQD